MRNAGSTASVFLMFVGLGVLIDHPEWSPWWLAIYALTMGVALGVGLCRWVDSGG